MAASQASDPAMSYWFRRDVSTVIRVSITPSVARSLPNLITDLISVLVLSSLMSLEGLSYFVLLSARLCRDKKLLDCLKQ